MLSDKEKTSEKLSALYLEAEKHFHEGGYEEAYEIIRLVIDAKPHQMQPYLLAGLTLQKLFRFEEAVQVLSHGIASSSVEDKIMLYRHKIYVLATDGQVEKALETAEEALEKYPEAPELLVGFASIANNAGPAYYKKGIDAAEKALQIDPDNYEALNCIGAIFSAAGKFHHAADFYLKVLRKKPDHLPAVLNAAGCFDQMKEHEMAVKMYDSALALKSDDGLAMAGKASVLANHGMAEENVDLLIKGVELLEKNERKQNFLIYFSNLIFYLHYIPNYDPQKIMDYIVRWHDVVCADIIEKPRIEFKNTPDKKRKLKIGLISNSFKRHPVTWMTMAALDNLNKDEFELHCYCALRHDRYDGVTKRLFDMCEAAHDIVGMSNPELVNFIRNDEIDILLELTGHSEGGRRLPASAARVAPVQVKWVGGLFNTTGVPAIDWLIGDSIEVPEGDERWYTEQVYRMPDNYIVYEPPSYVDEVQPLPAMSNGFVTFGSLNNLAKTNTYTISVWSKILKSVPNSRLLMKVTKLTTPFAKKSVEDQFAKHGIGIDRLVLEDGDTHKPFMETNHRIDIALDPHPYAGGLTTCEALWMGVPVVTLPGETFAGKHAATHLFNAGLPDWIAKDEQEYIDIAVKWANDLEGLAKLRAGLREQVANSPLCDGPRFAKNFEKALRFMWEDWCNEKQAADEAGKPEKSKKKGKK